MTLTAASQPRYRLGAIVRFGNHIALLLLFI